MAGTILITTSSFDTSTPEIRVLTDAGYTLKMNPHGRRVTEEEVKALLTPDVVGMIAGVEPLTASVMKGAPNLQIISRCGTGMDSVDIDAANTCGIALRNTPDAPAEAVAELAIGLILAALRHIPVQDRTIRAGKWDRPMGALLSKAKLGVIGYGRIGRRVATIASSFGAKIIAYDPVSANHVKLDDVLAQSDIVTLHLPYSQANHNLIGKAQIVKMQKGAILVNTSRGGLVDESAAAEALRSGHLGAAAFDVFEEEPYTGELAKLDNVILTPHIGSYAKEARAMQEAEAAVNLYQELMRLNQKEKTHG